MALTGFELEGGLIQMLNQSLDGFITLIGYSKTFDANDVTLAIFTLTTLITSFWTALLVAAAIGAKAMAAANRGTRFLSRMFDVHAHPVRVIGLAAAGMAWAASALYGLI